MSTPNDSRPFLGSLADSDPPRASAERSPGLRRRIPWAAWIDAAVVIALTAAGTLSGAGAALWYRALAVSFTCLSGAVLCAAGSVTFFSERRSERLQGPRRKAALMAREARATALAAWIAACLLAWPLSRLWSGQAIGLVWDLAQAGGGLRVFGQTFAALLVLDAWLYWKHRLLHTRLFFAFHREHHTFRDPTAFAGFAVGPVESLLTFWPIVLLALPEAIHYGPLYFTLVIGFVVLNLYLHCGIALRLLEASLPRLFINTSAHHNRHHANADVNFAEAFTLWDHLCRTREEDLRLQG